MKFNFINSENREFNKSVCRLVFRYSLVSFIFFSCVDLVLPGFVTNYFNPFWLLLIAIFSGILAIDKN